MIAIYPIRQNEWLPSIQTKHPVGDAMMISPPFHIDPLKRPKFRYEQHRRRHRGIREIATSPALLSRRTTRAL